MKKTILWILAVSLPAAGSAVAVWQMYFTETASSADRLTVYGNVDIREVELAFTVAERVAQVLVEEGETVTNGQLLATLEPSTFGLEVDRATARVEAQKDVLARLEAGTRKEELARARAEAEAARSRWIDAQRTYRRLAALSASDAVSQERADDARALMNTARARFEAARASLELAVAGPRREDIAAARSELKALQAEVAIRKRNLADTNLWSPGEGAIRDRILEVGDMASPSRPVFTLALTDPVWIRTYVPETALGKIHPGMRARIETDSFPGKSYAGWIGYISPTAEFTPKTVETPEIRSHLVYQVRVYACNPQNELRLGMPVTVVIPLNQERASGLPPECGKKP